MKKLFLHIGCEKTGSTTLQSFLFQNESLLNKQGFTYFCNPDKPYFSNTGHFPIAGAFLKNADFIPHVKIQTKEIILNSLKKDLGLNDKNIILSCEHFSSQLRANDIAALNFLKKNYDVKIVCYIRRQDDFALSAYSTGVLNGRRSPFSLKHTLIDDYFNFEKILTRWANVFGSENILVRPYNRNQFPKNDVCFDFLQVIGVHNTDDFQSIDNENISYNAKTLESLRLINFYLPQFDEVDRNTYANAQNIRFSLLPYLPSGNPTDSLLTTADRQKILKHFKKSNQRVEKKFMQRGALSSWHCIDTGDDRKQDIMPNAKELCQLFMRFPDDFKIYSINKSPKKTAFRKRLQRFIKRKLRL